ncbi:lytic polysaccharide monooxygenase [Pseudoalteromonas xiamenensis]
MKQHVKVSFSMLGLCATVASVNVAAHGYLDFPKARQSICEAQGGYWWPEDGSNIPNLACRAAFLESGYVQFTQEHEFSVNTADYRNQAAVEANIPDGQLCSAGDKQKRGINLPSIEWQKTVVTPNEKGQVTIKWNATTPHNPSFWKIYLTKPSFSPATDELRWQDLDLISEFGNLEFVKDPSGKRYYNMTIDIPKDRQGDAILYTRWQRIDVVGEGFYNCSDVHIVQDATAPTWHKAGYFVTASQQPKIDDKVWARVFDGSGQEIVSQSLNINNDNVQRWATTLAEMLNLNFSQWVKVGIKNANGDIEFDPAQLLSNEVYVTDAEHTYNLTIQVPTPNTPPVVHQPDPILVDENGSVSLHVHAFDDEQSELTYHYETSAPLSVTGVGATVTVNAASVDKDTQSTIRVMVSDGELETSKDIAVTITNTDQSLPIWSATKVYWGGDQVMYNGKRYEAKWWTQGEQPDKAQVWKAI